MARKVLRPFEIGVNNAWNLSAGATKVIAVDPGEPPNPDRSTYIESALINSQDFKPRKDFSEKMTSVQSVIVKLDGQTITGGSSFRFRLTDRLGTWLGTPFAPGSDPTEYSDERTTLSDNSTAWSEDELRNANFGFGIDNLNTNWGRVNAEWAEALYVPTVISTTFPRITISQMMHEFVLRHGFASLDLPIWALNIRLMEHFFLIHPEGPHPDGEGWKDLDWQRRLFRFFGIQFDPDGDLKTVHVSALDLRKYLTYLRDSGVSSYSAESAVGVIDGPLRLDMGVVRNFTRATVATAEDVDGVVVQIPVGSERVDPEGTLIEDFRKNFARQSSFKAWAGGPAAAPDDYTEVDPDANLTIARVTNGIFKSDLNTYGCRLTSSNGAGGNYGLNQAQAFAWEKDDNGVLSIDHEDHSGQGLNVGIRRPADNWWWNVSTGLWQAGSYFIRFPVAPAGTIVRDYFGFDHGAGIINYTGLLLIAIRVDLPNQDCTLHHVQLEAGNDVIGECGLWYPTSRIITESAAAVPRNAEVLTLATNPVEGRRMIHPDHGTLFCKIKVDYAEVALTDPRMGVDRSLGILDLDMFTVTPACHLDYNTANSRFEFAYRGVTAYGGSALTAGEYVFALRWCSDNGELGLAARTIDLFVNGVKGTSAVGTAMTEDSGSKLLVYGAHADMTNLNRINGWISRLFTTPVVLTDEEVKAWTDRIT
jgi:hypothetical protein